MDSPQATGPDATAVLFLDQTGQLGGAELMLADLAEHRRERSAVLLLEEGPFRALLEVRGVRVTVRELARKARKLGKRALAPGTFTAVPAMLGLVRQIAREARAFDVIYANTAKALILGGMAAKLARRPLVFHLHDIIDARHFGAGQRRLLVGFANRCASAVIANSEATKRAFVAVGGKASLVRVIHNGFRIGPAVTPSVQSTPDGPPVILLAGRLTPWKGQHVLLEALRRIPAATAVLAGEALFTDEDRAFAAKLRETAESPELKGRVRFAGFQADMAPWYRAATVVAHCSTAPEPFGRVVVEAMLAGRPVVATALGGVPEIVDEGVTGILVAPNDPAALAQALLRVLDGSAFAARLAQAGQLRAREKFNLADILRQTNEVIAAVAAGRRRGAEVGRGEPVSTRSS